MSSDVARSEAVKEKRPIAVLRERRGGMSDGLKAYYKRFTEIRKQLKGALGGGARTIPDLSIDTGLPRHEVLWHVMAMKKYGTVVEGERRGDYFAYRLASEE